MLLTAPAALPLTLLAASAPATTNLLAIEVPGAQPIDALYVVGVIGVFAFAARGVFDSAFPENTNEYKTSKTVDKSHSFVRFSTFYPKTGLPLQCIGV